MPLEIKVPGLGESITEAVVLEWLVQPGEQVAQDQDLVALETDKITVNVPSPVAGVLHAQVVGVGDTVEVGAVVASIEEGAVAASAPAAPASASASASAPAAAPAKAAAPVKAVAAPKAAAAIDDARLMPSVRRLVLEHSLDPTAIHGTGRDGRLLKKDVLAFIERGGPEVAPVSAVPAAQREEVVPMSRLRRRIAERLVEAQQTAAMLTTFNEVDMSAVMAMRREYKEGFIKAHGVKLGFTGFFAKAVVAALKAYPGVNAEIRDETNVVFKNHYDIGVAVGGGRGLVVPVIRDADRLSFAEFEKALGALARKARENKLAMDDLQGGTFTISNGGVYGSMLSTPILNMPQSGILGLHKIEKRPVVVDDAIVIRPMMYLALSYDHRVVDGREAVSFLVKVKEGIEDPARLLIEV